MNIENDQPSPADPALPGVGARLRARRRALGLTLAQVAKRAGMATSYLSMIETGRVARLPSADRLRALAGPLGIDEDELLLAAAWEQTPAAVRRELARLQSDEKVSDTILAPPRVVPLINKVAAGYPTGFTDLDYPASVADQYVPAPNVSDPDAFAATVAGDSMLPGYAEGDIVVFSPLADVKAGSDCFVRIEPDHETTFKRVFFEPGAGGREMIRLQPLNPAFPPRVLPREQVAGLYRAVWRMSAV